MRIKTNLVCLAAAAALLLPAVPAGANRSSVAIEVPSGQAQAGKITIRCTTSHSSNNFLHHTAWLHVLADGKEIARWDFSWRRLPENAVFSRDITVDVPAPVAIEAEASCNIHGSKGSAKITLQPAGKTP